MQPDTTAVPGCPYFAPKKPELIIVLMIRLFFSPGGAASAYGIKHNVLFNVKKSIIEPQLSTFFSNKTSTFYFS